jgi:hypothetical protein
MPFVDISQENRDVHVFECLGDTRRIPGPDVDEFRGSERLPQLLDLVRGVHDGGENTPDLTGATVIVHEYTHPCGDQPLHRVTVA